jgi:AcrR family transcriptional regulator
MTEIASAAQLAKPTLYHYFRSKEELLVRIYEEVLDESLASVEAIAENTSDPFRALESILIQRVIYTCENQQLLKVCFEEENELPHDLSETLFRRRRALEEVILHCLSRFLDSNKVTLAVAPRVFVNSALGAVNWVYKWYDPLGTRSPQELGQDIADLLLAPLRELTR